MTSRVSVMKGLLMGSVLIAAGLVAPVGANTPVLAQVTGTVTAISGNNVIVVNGTRYLIGVSSAAFTQLPTIKVGQSVGLIMDGPATSSGSHVISIQPVTSSK